MKASVKIVLDTRYKKQNSDTYPARLRVTHNRKQKYFPTQYEFTQKEWDKMTGNRPDNLKDKLFELQDIEKKARKIISKMPVFDFEIFGNKYKGHSETSTLKGAFNNYIAELKENGQPGTASNYECALNSLSGFKPGMLLTDVTIEFLKKYETYMEDKSPTTISMYLRALRTIINKAIAQGDFPQEAYPFGRYKFQPPQSHGNKRSIPLDVIGKIYNYEGEYEKAKDFWLFSYFGNGINMKDLSRLKYSNINTERDTIVYQRAKTIRTKRNGDSIEIDYIPDMKEIVKKYGTGGSGDDYIFPILHKGVTPVRERQLVQQFTAVINDHLKKIALELNIKPFTTYAARHAFATVQRDAGISVAAMSKMLGHGDTKTTEAYLNSLDVKTIKMASKNLTAFKKNKIA